MTRCSFGFHTWTKWGEPEGARWAQKTLDVHTGVERALVLNTLVQRRTCDGCGKLEVREVANK